MSYRGILLLLVGLLLTACAAGHDRKLQLDDTLRGYERTLRWDDIAKTAQFQRESGEVPDRSEFRGLRVTGYRVLNRKMEPDQTALTQTVELTYFREDEAVERTVTYTQRWAYDPERKAWLLETPLPRFR